MEVPPLDLPIESIKCAEESFHDKQTWNNIQRWGTLMNPIINRWNSALAHVFQTSLISIAAFELVPTWTLTIWFLRLWELQPQEFVNILHMNCNNEKCSCTWSKLCHASCKPQTMKISLTRRIPLEWEESDTMCWHYQGVLVSVLFNFSLWMTMKEVTFGEWKRESKIKSVNPGFRTELQ